MFEENDNLVLENTENVEETTEETEGTVEEPSIEKPAEPEKKYTDEELDSILAKKLARKEAKIRKELEKEYDPYKRLGTVVKAGLGVEDVNEATKQYTEFYKQRGVKIPDNQPTYNENDEKVLANAEAQSIIEAGYEDVVEEVDRLAEIGVKNMTPREKLVFTKLAEYRQAEGSKKELASIGVKADILDSKEFKEFAKDFKPTTPITKVYERYTKTLDKPQLEKLGSMKNGDSREEKEYFTSDEIDKLTERDYEDPAIFEKVRRSLAKL